MLLAVAAACGGSGGGGNTQLPRTILRITTIGDGLVRGGSDPGDCRGTCATLTPMGSQLQLQAIPDPGAMFVGWTGACNGTGPCKLTVDRETAVTATFDRKPPPLGFHHLTVVVDGSGHVVSTPAGLDCDSTCSAELYTLGGTVTR
jgi:hypothetical protein